jgi:hypothetical protein
MTQYEILHLNAIKYMDIKIFMYSFLPYTRRVFFHMAVIFLCKEKWN